MFGKIIKIEDKIIYVENPKKEIQSNLIGYHVVFEDNKKLVGEIIFVDSELYHIQLIGEIYNDELFSGVLKFPSVNASCRIVSKRELEMIIGSQDIQLPKTLLLGKSNVYDDFNITVKTTDFFSNHFAVVGNTGSGKSCGVARIIQNLFATNKQNPDKSHFVIFDAYGEYQSALKGIDKHYGINVKNYTTENSKFAEMIKIPPYFLEVDDLALLLNLQDSSLIPVLEKTLRYVYIFKSNDETCKKYKNDIIAKSIIDILSSGKPAQQIRDQIIAFLTDYNTPQINLNSIIYQPGYERTLKQCLNIDNQGKMPALDLVLDLLKEYSTLNIEKIEIKPVQYTLDDLYYALEFALISEGILNSSAIFESSNQLKTRLHSLINSEHKKYFEYDEFITKGEYIQKLFSNDVGEPVQLIDINFNYIDDRFAKVIVKILCKLFYNFTTNLNDRGSFPINILIEEAHRYIQRDTDIDVIGYNVFERIAKEGRKYGLLLGLITQRICELSSIVLSQCSNFIIFRMYYPEDLKIISSMASNINMEIIEKVKALRAGSALIFGNAFKMPLIAHFEIPNPMPTSTNVNLLDVWYK